MAKLLKRAPPAAKVLRSSRDLAIELSSNEGFAESRQVMAQTLWGDGNLAPYDNVFAAGAVMALVLVTSSAFGVVAPRLAGRLKRLSEEIGVWIDASETEPVRFSLDRRKTDKVRKGTWESGKGVLRKERFTALYLAQPSQFANPLAALYAEGATGLRTGGQVFVADLVSTETYAQAVSLLPQVVVPGIVHLQREEDHRSALAAAKLEIQNEFDMTRDLMLAVRNAFLKALGKLSDVRALDQPWRNQRLVGFLAELECWFKLYRLIELGHVKAKGLLAAKA